ncbi:MAG: hypothetical protein IJB97_07325 [Clostridia bacterium]|nr:hypothetical protein [Clostridia bacterium]
MTFHKGFTLFKAALIVFCIVAAESLASFFLKDRFNLPVWYPVLAFSVATATLIVCTILWAIGFHAKARKQKHAAYFLTASVIFVICFLVVSMIAVFLQIDLTTPNNLIAYLIIPTVYLLNVIFFAVFYHLFVGHTTNK